MHGWREMAVRGVATGRRQTKDTRPVAGVEGFGTVSSLVAPLGEG